MSATIATLGPETRGATLRRQARAVARLELARSLSWRSGLWLFLLGLAPALIIGLHGFVIEHSPCRLDEDTLILAGIVQVYYIRFAIFFGCLGIAMRMFRGEVAQKTLHYAFLAPVRRDVLVVGKFAAGAASAMLIFGGGVLVCFALMYGHFDAGREYVTAGPALAHLRSYLLAALLACLGYLAVSLAFTLLFKNPIVPAVAVLFWEGLNGILPVWLKRFSVTFYLKPLFPVELPIEGISGLFTVVAEPTPIWLCVVGLLAFSGLALAFACWRVRRLEVSYSTD